jgi:hypothetical protein
MTNLFERLSKERPTPVKTKTHKDDPAQRLLDFLQRWPEPTVCAQNILQFGPNSIRKQKAAHDAIATLVKYGWLVPTKTKQSNWRRWEIVHKATVRPKVAG